MPGLCLQSSHLTFRQYVCVISFRKNKKNKEFKTALMTSFTLLPTRFLVRFPMVNMVVWQFITYYVYFSMISELHPWNKFEKNCSNWSPHYLLCNKILLVTWLIISSKSIKGLKIITYITFKYNLLSPYYSALFMLIYCEKKMFDGKKHLAIPNSHAIQDNSLEL